MKTNIKLLIVFIVILIGALLAPRSNEYKDYKLEWSDEFNSGTLENTHFTTEWAWRGDCVNSDEAIKIHDGNLEICPFTKGDVNYSGFITTENKYEFKEGIIEIRVKFNTGHAAWSDCWMTNYDILWNGENANSEEIDLLEHRGFDKNNQIISSGIDSNIYFPCYGPGMKYITKRSDEIIDNKFHVFKLRRENGECEFYCDNNSLLRAIDPRPNCDLYLILSVEIDDGNWAGKVSKYYDGSPAMTVDYIRVYKKLDN